MMDDSLILACVTPSLIDRVWPRVSEMIDKGFEAADEIMPLDMIDRLIDDRVQLWLAMSQEDGSIHAACTTELVPMRSGLTCWICQASGVEYKNWAHFHKRIEEYAKAEGCVKTVIRGRAGWKKALEGYSVRAVQLEKVL